MPRRTVLITTRLTRHEAAALRRWAKGNGCTRSAMLALLVAGQLQRMTKPLEERNG